MSGNEVEIFADENDEGQDKLCSHTCYVSPTDLIQEVKLRPALYVPDHEDRHMTDFRTVLWTQIADKIIQNFECMTKVAQSETIAELQKKWRNIKDSYRKELRAIKMNQPKYGNKSKRKYIYFNKLSFLRPILEEDIEATMNKHTRLLKKKQKPIREDEYEVYDPETDLNNIMTPDTSVANLSSYLAEEIDEDKNFLLSLVPTFKRMNNDQKLTAKVEFLNVLRNLQSQQYYPGMILNNSLNDATSPKRRKRKQALKKEIKSSDESPD